MVPQGFRTRSASQLTHLLAHGIGSAPVAGLAFGPSGAWHQLALVGGLWRSHWVYWLAPVTAIAELPAKEAVRLARGTSFLQVTAK